MKHIDNHGEVILKEDGGKIQDSPSDAFWTVRQILEGANTGLKPVRVFRTKRGFVWRFVNLNHVPKSDWWQTCNEDPVVAELMAAQFKSGMYGKPK